MKSNKRFIAGATCPGCNEIDSLLLNIDDQGVECVDCGYTQTARERDHEKKHTQVSQSAVKKMIPGNVEVSNIIQVTNIKG